MGRNLQPKYDANKTSVFFHARNTLELKSKLKDRYELQLRDLVRAVFSENGDCFLIQLFATEETLQLIRGNENGSTANQDELIGDELM